jgi:hypothetical protein
VSRRWHHVYPGGFVRTTLLSRKFDVGDPRCWFCLTATCGPWWFHLETRRVVCSRCLPDPWRAEFSERDERRIGELIARRLVAMRRPGEEDTA